MVREPKIDNMEELKMRTLEECLEKPYLLLTPGPLTTSNEVRMAMLKDWCTWDKEQADPRSGMTPREQIEAILDAVAPLYKERDKTYAEIKKQLTPYGVCGLSFKELQNHEKNMLKSIFGNRYYRFCHLRS